MSISVRSQATSSVTVRIGSDGAEAAVVVGAGGQEATAQVTVTGDVAEVSTTDTTTVVTTPENLPLSGFTLYTFSFTTNEGTRDNAVVFGGPPEGGLTAGEEYFHNRGEGDIAIADFDPATDRFTAYGESAVNLEVTGEAAILHLSDGTTVTLALSNFSPVA